MARWRRAQSLSVITLLVAAAPLRSLASPGDLDTTFAGDGTVSTPVGASGASASDVAIQSDGRIVLIGTASNGSRTGFALVRYNPDGTLDTSLDADGAGPQPPGMVITLIGSGDAAAAGVEIEPDGRIVVVGTARTGSQTGFAVARYNPDGTLDSTLDADGSGAVPPGPVITSIGTGDASAQDVAVQPDGRIVVCGASHNGTDDDFALIRYNADGTLDTSFAVEYGNLPGIDEVCSAIALQPDGRIVASSGVFGVSPAPCSWPAGASIVTRFNANGSLDLEFDTPFPPYIPIFPYCSPPPLSFYFRASDVRVRSDGTIVQIGTLFSYLLISPTLVVSEEICGVRYDGVGAIDATWHTSVGAKSGGHAVATHQNGKITVVGEAVFDGSPPVTYATVARYDGDGNLDASFNSGGIAVTPIQTYFDDAFRAVAVQADGKIVAAGFTDNGSNEEFAVVRYLGDPCGNGIPDPGEQCDDMNVADGDCCDSDCQYESSGAPCPPDGNPCTLDACDGAGTCGQPPTSCKSPGKSVLVYKNDPSDDSGDKLIWKWVNGEQTLPGELGDPTDSTDYTLCLDSAAGSDWLPIPHGSGWRAAGTSGFKYATPTGSLKARLKGGAAGKSKALVKGKGVDLPAGFVPQLPVLVRLVDESLTTCFEVTYSSAETNTPTEFKAKTP